MRKDKISLEFFNKLNREHLEGKSLSSLCKEYGVKFTTLYYGFRRNNLTIIKANNEQRKRIPINKDFFSIIDSEIKAYLLGWVMSDGFISKRKESSKSFRFGIKLQDKDIEILNLFRENISPKAKLYKEEFIFNNKETKSLKLEITSNKLVNDLISLGVTFNKTFNGEIIPNIDKLLIRHFVRGFFDGDGSISIGKGNKSSIYICSINLLFIKSLYSILEKEDILTSIYTELRGKNKTMYKLGIRSRVAFFNYMYKDHKYSLKRKFDKFNQVNTVLTAKYNKLATV